MRPLLLLAVLAACGSSDDDTPEVDGGLTPGDTCMPAAAPPPPADGDGTPPVGRFTIEWRCIEGCGDDVPPLVIMQGNSIDITAEGVARWVIDDEPLYPITLNAQDGCWYQHASLNGCHGAFFVCDQGGGPRVARISVRSLVDGHEESWEMR